MVACNPLSHNEFSTTESKDALSLQSCSARCGDSGRPRVCIQRDVGLTDVIASLETPGSNAVSWSSLQAHPPMEPISVALRKTRKLQLVFEGLMMISRRRTLKSTLHPAIFWEMVKFVDLGVLYLSLVLPV